jgi:hypothetical protein
MAPNVGEAVTRKLGPLPTWGWAIVIGGGVLLYRALRSGGSSSSSSGGVSYIPVGNPGATGGYGDPGDSTYGQGQPGTAGEAGAAGAQGIQGEMGATGATGATGAQGIAGAAADVASLLPRNLFTSYNTLLVRLSELLQSRGDILSRIEDAETALARDAARYADKSINLYTYNYDVSKWTAVLNEQKAQLASTDQAIATTRSQLNTTAVGSGY